MNIFYAVLKNFNLLKSVMFTTLDTENVNKVSWKQKHIVKLFLLKKIWMWLLIFCLGEGNNHDHVYNRRHSDQGTN